MSQTELPTPDQDKVEPRGETIDFADMPVLNDPNCEHEFVAQTEVDIPNTVTELCRKCPVGRIVRL